MMSFRREWVVVVALALVSVGTTAFAPPKASPPPTASALPTAVESATADVPLDGSDSSAPNQGDPPEAEATEDLRQAASTTPSPAATAIPSAQAVYAWRAYDGLASITPAPTAIPEQKATPFPFDTRPDLDRYIYIDQWTQHMYVFEHGKLIRDIPASCGLPDPDKYTEPWNGQVGRYWGTFYAFDVYADEAWYLYMSAGSILIHSLPYTLQNGYKVYQDREALGVQPASHGCVRIAPEDAAWLTQWNPEGVEATVTDPYLERWRSILSN